MQQHRAGAEVDLGSLGRGEVQPDGGLRRDLTAQLPQQPHDGGVAAAPGVLALQRGMDGTALHAGVEPGLDERPMRLGARDGGTGPARRADGRCEDLVGGQFGGRV